MPAAAMSNHFATGKASLNGWWDFFPVQAEDLQDLPPADGWLANAVLVPSVWSKSRQGWRRPGEPHFRPGLAPEGADDVDYLGDAFAYPAAWNRTRTAWLRRTFDAARPAGGRRLILGCDGLGPRAMVLVNGIRVAEHADPFLPLEADITAAVRDGANELAVLIRPYPLHRGRSLIPCGNSLTQEIAGIWQDCWLVERGGAMVGDIAIRTSTRQRRLQASAAVAGPADGMTVTASVHAWLPGGGTGPCELALDERRVHQDDGGVAWDAAWDEARWWEPGAPHLYWLCLELRREGAVIDRCRERFGFREVWIEGPDLMLNGHPVHLASDWGHKAGHWCYSEAWVRQWFGMIRDANMNHTRLHTHPHPRTVLDLADEMGVLVTGETALHGSGNAQAADHPAFWEAARRHLLGFIARDRNRPSVVLWSIENEMRFEREGRDLTRRELPELRRLAEAADPTRIAYHEGDSSVWDEGGQRLLSRHYGRLCSGLGWWDRRQPLHSGEMSVHHLNGPNVTLHLAGDAGWADYRACSVAASEDARQIIEGGRTLGVCCFGPWNLSCLENLRPEPATIRPHWADWTAPGIKALVVPPHSSEFAFWKPGPGYTPSDSFAILAQAFRPVAVIDLSLRSRYLAGAQPVRRLHLVNDGTVALRGELVARLRRGGAVLAESRWTLDVDRGRCATVTWTAPLPATPGEVDYEAEFLAAAGGRPDAWRRTLAIHPDLRDETGDGGVEVALIGGTPDLRATLRRWGHPVREVAEPDAACGSPILLVGPGAVPPGGAWTAQLRCFVAGGGRAILLEQNHGVLPGAELQEKAVSTAFPRAYGHPLLDGLAAADLAWWGEDAYARIDPDHRVARRLYRKDGGDGLLAVIDSGEGGFGDGDLEFAAVLESADPAGGLLLACQLEVGGRLYDIPAAQRLLRNLLRRAASWSPPAPAASAAVAADADAAAAVALARAGATVLVDGLGPDTVAAWAAATGLPLALRDTGPVYQLVRVGDDPLLAGISNADLCGIDNWIYGSPSVPVTVARHALAPCSGLEPVLATPTDSLLREQFVAHGRTELLRAHTASRFLFAERAAPAVGLGRVRIGSGQLLFWQFTAGDGERRRCGRAQRRLRRNLGLLPAASLLVGDMPAGSGGSPGYPQRLWILAEDLSGADLDRLRDATGGPREHGLPEGPLRLRRWREIACPDGVVTAAALGAGRPILLYTRLRSPRDRRPADIDLGVPNPDAFTYCELSGDGRAQMTMDGYRFLPTDLSSGQGTVQDMAMSVGYNQSLLAWWPAGPASTLRIRWHNSLLQPETSFGFV
jgi:beta-galactosidase